MKVVIYSIGVACHGKAQFRHRRCVLEHRRGSIDRRRVYMRERDVQRGRALHFQLEYVRGREYSQLFDG